MARLGGDEFAVVQIGRSEEAAARALAGRLVEVISAPYEIDDHQIVIGVSIGISLSPQDGDNPDELLKNADLALYRAKADGRGTYRFFETGMDARAQARRLLEMDMRAALQRDEFELVLPAHPRRRERSRRRLRGAAALEPSAARPDLASSTSFRSPRRPASSSSSASSVLRSACARCRDLAR